MPNVLITTNCNQSCNFCFAKEKMQDKAHQNMSLDNVQKVISFLRKSNDTNFRLMGGEPTIHPNFREILAIALEEGMHVDLLSNGTWPSEYNEMFARISPSNLSFLLNISPPDQYPPDGWKRIENNLASIGGRKGVSLSFNIFDRNPKFEYIFDLTKRYQIHNVRLSFSLPVLGINNERLDLEDYSAMGDFIVKFTRQGEDIGVDVRLDNAVPLCAFSYEQIGELIMKGALDLNRNARCKPVIDIGPDLTVWCCFCLSKLSNRNLNEFENTEEIQSYYQQILNFFQGNIFPLDDCYSCKYRTIWGCQGGCVTFSVEKYLSGCKTSSQKISSDNLPDEDAIPILANGVSIRKYEIPRETYVLKNANSGEIEIGTALFPLITLLDGRHTIQDIVEVLLQSNHQKESDSVLDNFERQIFEEGYKKLLSGFINENLLSIKPIAIDSI